MFIERKLHISEETVASIVARILFYLTLAETNFFLNLFTIVQM